MSPATSRFAIVGVGAVLPDAADLGDFWRLVVEGRSVSRTVPEGRWSAPTDDVVIGTPPRADSVASVRGCFVDCDALPLPAGAAGLDPMFRIGVAAARRAMADANGQQRRRERTGVIIGNIVAPTDHSSRLSGRVYGRALEHALFGGTDPEPIRPARVQENLSPGRAAVVIADDLGLGGTAYTLDAACASSLYALNLACCELSAGRADAMLTGGLSRPSALYTQMGFTQLKALAPDGICAPFDANSKGLVLGEGAAMFVVKRLADAIADGDHIHAVVVAIGVSNDVAGSLLAPDPEGQLRAMRAAYEAAGWSPGCVDLIECHATGTPLGDAVEIESMRRLWAETDWRPGQCVIGSVKSNIGHLLTAAGAAGLTKVLLALQNRRLPPTANTREPAPALRLPESPFRVLTDAEDWVEPADRPRRAAISAFGFGGINAHLLIEEWTGCPTSAAVAQGPVEAGDDLRAPDLAIVGRAARVGPWQSAAAVDRRLLGLDHTEPARWADPPVGDASPDAPHGFFVDTLRVPLGRFRIPPNEFPALLPQQLLTLLTGADAVDDAAWQADWGSRAGVFVGIGLDMETGTFEQRWTLPERVRRLNARHGLGLDAAGLADWVAALRDAVSPALDADRALGVLGGIIASRLSREFRIGGPSFTVSADGSSGLKALEAAAHFLRAGIIDRAVVGAVDLPADRFAAAAEFDEGSPDGPIAEGAVVLVVRRLADAVADADRIAAVLPAGEIAATRTSALAATRLGRCGAADGLLEVYAAATLLQRGLAAPDRPWPRDSADEPRRLAVAVGGDRVVVSEPPRAPHAAAHDCWALSGADEVPVLFAGADRDGLIGVLESAAKADDDLVGFGRRSWQHRGDGSVRVGIAARDRAGLSASVSHAVALLQNHESADGLSQRRYGVHLSLDPLLAGRPEALAFVFPGSGNHSHGMGRSLALAFPDVLARQQAENALLRSQIQPELFWDGDDLEGLDERCEDLILGQVAFGTLAVDALGMLGIHPGAAVGYSLGETAALFGMRAWSARDEMLRRVRASSLFSADMAGELRAVRAAWGLGDDAPTPQWRVGVVDRPASAVEAVLTGIDRVYLLIVNTAAECVIGGDPAAVATAVEALGARFHPLRGITAVHCEAVEPVAEAYRALHLLPTAAPRGIRFYSGASGRPYPVDSESAAGAILDSALHGVDFPATVQSAYADGVRVFVETGPGASCTRMIGDILQGDRFAALSVADPARPESENLLRVALGVDAEGYRVDFAPLFARMSESIDITVARVIDVPRRRPATPPAPPAAAPPLAARREEPAPAAVDLSGEFSRLILDFEASASAHVQAHRQYLALSARLADTYSSAVALQMTLAGAGVGEIDAAPVAPKPFLDRSGCLEFAVGSVAAALGPAFAEADGFPTRVRLPDEPLMLVDRIVEVLAEPRSMTSGRLLTEHDVRPGAWYLDGDRIPTCIAVEAGQADLFLSGYLGVDFETRGRAVYRLLDAKVTFHRGLPRPGAVIRYDIAIDGFFRQGETILFRFRFDATVDGEPLLTMRDGCAGFFTPAELAAGRGVVRTRLQTTPRPGVAPKGGAAFVPLAREHYDEAAVEALRRGDLVGCFGPGFAGLPLRKPRTIPGAGPGSLLRLLDRVTDVDPQGGRFGLGLIRAELDVHPDDWFLVCHFSDDQVMPGTMMYECCLHTLRVFLLRLGWVGDEDDFVCEPVPGVDSQLRCRGQVVADTKTVVFEIEVKELGFDPDAYALADALMYADGRPIVEITDMSLRLSGLRRERLEEIWRKRPTAALFGPERLLAHAVGKPSEAFGEPYREFDHDRVMARLPGPPYLFLDRIVAIEGCRPWVLEAGGSVVAEYDVAPEAWYFSETACMPYAVLQELALQTCGWFAAYLGAALTSPVDLRLRNLGGTARQLQPVGPATGTLTTRVRMASVASSGGMIILNYDTAVSAGAEAVYNGHTYFGFFPASSLAEQAGIRDAELYSLGADERVRSQSFALPDDGMLGMLDAVDAFVPDGGPAGLGYIRGVKRVDPGEWFFAAHFHQDPVWPGSLGLEAFLQLLRIAAARRWDSHPTAPALGTAHTWLYRGQVLPSAREVAVEACVTGVDDAAGTLTASGLLSVDGRVIYQMSDFEVTR